MKHPAHIRRHPRGYISYVLVLTTSTLLTTLMLFAYKRSMSAQAVQADVQLHVDYSEKEETILRSVVAIAPNRAIRAMQGGANVNSSTRNPLRWQNIFQESLVLANAHSSVDAALINLIPGSGHTVVANSGDADLSVVGRIFRPLPGESGRVSRGTGHDLGAGFPLPLNIDNATDNDRDSIYPIISSSKHYGNLAAAGVGAPVSEYPQFNLIPYPEINFGYARPGEPFVAKHNWWAFRLDLANHDHALTRAARHHREMVFSIYEIPSQLAISASSFVNFGQHASGETWQNALIEGNVFAGRAQVAENTDLAGLASRRDISLSDSSRIGGREFAGNPFTPGLREKYLITEGDFFPVSLPSESGRAAFIPINRGADFFDRFSHASESNSVSSTTWNQYSVGALQCAMWLDIADAVSDVNPTPSALRFSYLAGGVRRTLELPLFSGIVSGLPPGYIWCCHEHQTYTFAGVVDVAYGANGQFYFQNNVTGPVTFNNARFGDPIAGTFKAGYFRPAFPWEVRQLPNGKFTVAIFRERFPLFLQMLGADDTRVNHSLAVNVDYPGSPRLGKPSIPVSELDYGVILEECADLTEFPRGFSLVTNLRLYIGDDFNTQPMAPPDHYTPVGDFFPPCSLFAPEKRFGVIHNPVAIQLGGQLGSLAAENAAEPVRLLDSMTGSGDMLGADQVRVNLRPIRHPAELPPITMMNWLVLIQERRREYFIGN